MKQSLLRRAMEAGSAGRLVLAGAMPRSVTIAVIIQGSGAVLAILTVFGLAHFLGASYQGRFAVYKNWFDLVSSSLLFGAPQGVVYAINKRHISTAFAAKVSLVYALVTVPVSFLINFVGATLDYLPGTSGMLTYLMIAIGCSGYIYHGLARSIFLTERDGISFSVLTVLPTLGISLVLAAQGLLFEPRIDVAFTLNGILCGLIAFASISRLSGGSRQRSVNWRSVIFRQSAHSFLQSLAISFQPLIIYALIRFAGGGVHEIGLFSFALITLVSINALISMIAPILYNRWSKATETGALERRSRRMLTLAIGVGSVLTAALIVVAPSIASLGKIEFLSSIVSIRILAAASIPLIFSRLLIPALLAFGRAETGTYAGVIRLLTAVVSMAALVLLEIDVVAAAAWAWLLSEWAAAIFLFGVLNARLGGERITAS